MFSRGLLTTVQMFCFCQWHLSKTQESLLSSFACHLFREPNENLTRIIMADLAKVSHIKKLEVHFLVRQLLLQVRATFWKTGVILTNFKQVLKYVHMCRAIKLMCLYLYCYAGIHLFKVNNEDIRTIVFAIY